MFKKVILKAHGNPKLQGQTEGLDKTVWNPKLPVYLAAAVFGYFLIVTLRIHFVFFSEIWGGIIPASFIYSLKDLFEFVLISITTSCFFVFRISKRYSRTFSKGERLFGIFEALLLIFVLFGMPFVAQPLEKFQFFTISTILLTGILIFFWLIVLVLAGIYQLEYKAIFGNYFHGRSQMNYNRK